MYQTFQQISEAYTDDDTAPSWKSGKSYRAAWAAINAFQKQNYSEAAQKEYLHWTNAVVQALMEYRDPITRVQKLNTKLYAGKHFWTQEQWSNMPYNYRNGKRYDPNNAKIVMNYLGQAVEQHVADLSAYEPSLAVSPVNDEEQDRVSSRMNKLVLDHYWQEWDLKVAFQTFHRRKKVHGETFAFLTWDPELGDYHPKYKQYRQMMRDQGTDPDAPIPLKDPETGAPILGNDREPLFISRPLKTGDLLFTQEYSARVLYPCPESYLWADVPYVYRLQWMDVDEARARWSKYAEKIHPDFSNKWGVGPSSRSITEKVLVRTLYHKPSRFLDRGFYTISCQSCLLEWGVYPFNHNELPLIRGTDIDLEFEITGMSFMQNLISLNHALNNSASMVLQNQALFAYPKYVAPRGAKTRYSDLGNDRGIFEFSGPKGPELMAQNSTPQDTWKFMDLMRNEFKTLSQIYATSRGEGVDGITANVALRMIDEQERKLHKPAIDKHGNNCVLLGKLSLWTLATYRDPTDGMLIRVLGRNNERYLKYFDAANLQYACEVTLQRQSGLPDSPAAKTQTILDLKQAFPGLWPDDEVLEMLDINKPERLVESATVARQAAESEVEDILSGVPNVPPPSPLDDILPKYQVYLKAVQGRNFKELPPVLQQRMILQIITAEYIISAKIKASPAFGMLVMQKTPNFPTIFPQGARATQFQLAQAPQLPATSPMGAPNLGGVDPAAAVGAETPPDAQNTPQSSPLPQETVPIEGALP